MVRPERGWDGARTQRSTTRTVSILIKSFCVNVPFHLINTHLPCSFSDIHFLLNKHLKLVSDVISRNGINLLQYVASMSVSDLKLLVSNVC